jgi:hypothetical protein
LRAGPEIFFIRLLAIIVCAFTPAISQNSAFATEHGGQSYPIGVNTVLPGIAPSPGQTFWQDYNVYYSAGTFKDDKGNSLIPGFKLDVAADAPRIFHGWDVQLGPFGLASALVVPFVYSDVRTAFSNKQDFDIGDPTIQPLYLTYVNRAKTFFAYGGVDFFVPTYTTESRRYLTADPIITMTWFPAKGIDINMMTLLEIPLTENTSTTYKSGDLLVFEYSGHCRPLSSLPMLSLGFNGYYVDQFSDDKLAGIDIGFRGQGFALGPEMVYQIGKAGGFAIKWQHEFDVRNRPEGEVVWFQFQVPSGGR